MSSDTVYHATSLSWAGALVDYMDYMDVRRNHEIFLELSVPEPTVVRFVVTFTLVGTIVSITVIKC